MTLEELLAGSDAGIRALDEAEPQAWQLLLEHLHSAGPEPARAELVEALLARDPSVRAWIARARRAAMKMRSKIASAVETLTRPFGLWLLAGVEARRAVDHPQRLDARVWALEHVAVRRLMKRELSEDDAFGEAEALLAAIRRTSDSPLLDDALAVACRWACEARRWDRAEQLAREAEARFAARGDAQRAAVARRNCAAALVWAGRVVDGLAVLDTAWVKTDPFPQAGRFTFGGRPISPAESALDELAAVIPWVDPVTPEYVRALGGVAEHPLSAELAPELWARFDRALATMLDLERGAELAVVVRQARERKLEATALRALAAGQERGI